ncbi:hypothetical protein BGZ60DRAFT_522756 [Tricladium varicosporioides]|nr:hypothetical protein BGZ60DRAFT_522756 [Hymenoscyphus varicosporioides]
MSFAPKSTPKGYSYLEDAPRYLQRELEKNKPPSGDTIANIITEAFLDEILKGKYARQATTFVQKGVGAVYKTSTGRTLINKITSTSLNKSVQGAPAISHVSKIARSHGISTFGVMVYNDGKLFIRYCNGNIRGTEFGKELFTETMGQSGDMLGWMIVLNQGEYIRPRCLPIARVSILGKICD